MQTREPMPGERIRGGIGVSVSLALVAASLTALFLSMRAVMDIGGTCASGGPFVPRVGCPNGVPALLVGSIWIGLIVAAAYFWFTFRYGAPSVGALFWPALFLSLGWNFLEYGLDPPFGSGVQIGWLVCAVVFGLMGGLPLIYAVPTVWRSFRGKAGTAARARDLILPRRSMRREDPERWGRDGWFRPTGDASGAAPTSGRPTSEAPTWVTRTTSSASVSPTVAADAASDDIVGALERLDALHRSGALTDAQYEEAKRRVIEP